MFSFCPTRAATGTAAAFIRQLSFFTPAANQHQKTMYSVRMETLPAERKVSSFHLPADLELGHVLLFPIDDKQSRPDGQDQVSLSDETEEEAVDAEGAWF